jgi:hypothetical protein
VSTELPDFLLARIADDEALARGVRGAMREDAVERTETSPSGDAGIVWSDLDRTMLAKRFSPERVLAECDAKRRIIELHQEALDGLVQTSSPAAAGAVRVGAETLMALALPYADHPDFRPEWAPTGTSSHGKREIS